VADGVSALADVVFRRVRSGNAFEETVERLLDGIKLGIHDRLPAERELAVRLGVSRVTVRDALRELADAGYVETRRGRSGGTFVIRRPAPPASIDVAELADTLIFRRAVEIGAAEAAASAALSRDQRVALSDALAEAQKAGLAEYRQADSRLHLAIADASGSQSLAASVVDARVRMVDLLDAIPMLEVNLMHSNDQHARIVAAILAGNPDCAREAMDEHVEGSAALLRGFLRSDSRAG
jgi:GntR family transcriptional regulator, L-lactate dehydrogenase operon regulator